MAMAFAPAPAEVVRATLRFLALVKDGTTEHEGYVPLLSIDELAEHEDSDASEAVLRDDGDCFAGIERRITYEPLYSFVRSLTYSQRELVYLIFWHGLSKADVARRRSWHPMKVQRELAFVLQRGRDVLGAERFALLAA